MPSLTVGSDKRRTSARAAEQLMSPSRPKTPKTSRESRTGGLKKIPRGFQGTDRLEVGTEFIHVVEGVEPAQVWVRWDAIPDDETSS